MIQGGLGKKATRRGAPSKSKRILFGIIAVLIPLLALAGIEILLRISGIGDSAYEEFIELPGRSDYVALNPEYVTRYFPSFTPAVPFTPFRKERDDSLYRVFVVGGSSTAGFPYQFYHGFPRRLAARLESSMLDRRVEVVNLGMTAVNSFTIWDLHRAIISEEPDAIVIYGGHNEFYGAFGVASTISNATQSLLLKRLSLTLKRTVLYSSLEKLIGSLRTVDRQDDRTLMSQVVRQSGITINSDEYLAGIRQFRTNMRDVVAAWTDAGIDVYVGTLASNLKDQAPLGDNSDAVRSFAQAQELLNQGMVTEARELFIDARDQDEIRFRAPSDINGVVRELEEFGATIVDIETAFANESSTGIPGDSLFTDHLHPNYLGYDLIAESFYQAMRGTVEPRDDYDIDALDRAVAYLQIAKLKSSYPFVKDLNSTEEQTLFLRKVDEYQGRDVVKRMAIDIVNEEGIVPIAVQRLVELEKSAGDSIAVLLAYRSLLNWQPLNLSIIDEAVAYGANDDRYDALVEEMAAMSMHRNSDVQSTNVLAAVRLRAGDLESARILLKKVEELDPKNATMLVNTARMLVLSGDTLRARDYFEKYQTVK